MFEGLVYSQVSEEFVKPLFPAEGEDMEVSVLFSPELCVDFPAGRIQAGKSALLLHFPYRRTFLLLFKERCEHLPA